MSDPPCPEWWEAEDYEVLARTCGLKQTKFLTAMEAIADLDRRGHLAPMLQDLFDDCFSQHFFWLGREALPR